MFDLDWYKDLEERMRPPTIKLANDGKKFSTTEFILRRNGNIRKVWEQMDAADQ